MKDRERDGWPKVLDYFTAHIRKSCIYLFISCLSYNKASSFIFDEKKKQNNISFKKFFNTFRINYLNLKLTFNKSFVLPNIKEIEKKGPKLFFKKSIALVSKLEYYKLDLI